MEENKWIELGNVRIWTGCQDVDRREWLELRNGSVGASEIEALTKDTAGGRDDRRRKAIERLGLVDETETSFQSHAMKRGLILEEQAAEVLADMLEIELFKIGLVRNKLWPGYHVSPDRGFFRDGKPIPVEIKCLESPAHLQALKKGTIPEKYFRQVGMQMLIMESPMAVSFCWHPNIPPVLSIHRMDEQEKESLSRMLSMISLSIDEEVRLLQEEISRGWARSKEAAEALKEELKR